MMEIGRIAEIENSKVNNSEKTQKVINVDEKNKVIQEDKYKKALGSGDIADKNEINTFLAWLIKVAPTCWVWFNTIPFTLTLNKRACMRSHSQRFCFSQAFSLISCMPVTSCTMLL